MVILPSCGLDFVRAVQSIAGRELTFVMKLVTNLVSEYVFFAVLMVLFWAVNEKKAFRLGILLVCTVWVNAVLKSLFNQPRPFHLENALGMIDAAGGGFPSGHAQLAAVFFIPLAFWYAGKFGKLPRGAVWIASAALILLVSFSRIYLGVHFPQDILGGWFFAAVLLVPFFLVERHGFPGSLRLRLTISAAAAAVMGAALPAERLPAALFLGFASGYALMRTFFSFDAGKNTAGLRTAADTVFRLLLGVSGAVLLYFGLKLLFPGPSSSWYSFFRFIRYAILGFWVSAGAPRLFACLPAARI